MNSQYKLLVDKAYELHSKGDYNSAEVIYLTLLKVKPDDANVLNLYGLLSISLKNYDKAITLLSKAFLYNKSAYTAVNLAKAYYINNEVDNSVKMYKQALNFEENDDIYYSLAISYKKLGNLENAIESYLKAVELNPENYNALYNIALAYHDTGDNDKALYFALKAFEINDSDKDLLTLLSGFYETKGDYVSAVKYLRRAIDLFPGSGLYYYNLGVLYSKISDTESAIENYKKAIIINPGQVEAYVNIAALYKEKNPSFALEYLKTAYKIDNSKETLCLALAQLYKDLYKNNESRKILLEILKKNPKSSEAYSLLAINAMDTADYEKALEYSERALNLQPENLDYMHGKAIALKYLGRYEEAKNILEKIVSNPACDNQSKIALGMMYLQEKNFYDGMKLYLKRNSDTRFYESFKDKMWKSYEDFKDKIVLVYSNCGLGDTIMYARFLPQLKNIAKEVIVQTDKELINILKYNFQDICFFNKSDSVSAYDTTIPVMDLQYALNIDFEHIIQRDKYLNADDTLVEKFSKYDIFNTDKKKIGLFWQGNKKIFKNRSLPYELIGKITDNCKFRFYSFQLKNSVCNNPRITNLDKYINDYADTAALLKNTDILITIDSSVVHMAGALGVKTFLLLPYTAEWRWFFDTDKTIWYKSVKIFKQSSPNNWQDVIDNVISELDKYAGQ